MSCKEKQTETQKVNLDNILTEELGQFGRYQLVALGLAILPTFFWTFATHEYTFTTARISSRCSIPECDDFSPDFSAPWREYAIPKLENGAFDQCSRFGSNSSQWAFNGTCPASLFDTSTTEPCQDYVYQNDHTIVYDFDLACDEWRRSLVGSIRIVGNLLALPITGYVSDRWGRRVALAVSAFNTGWLGLARSFANSYEWFTALAIIETTLGYGSYSCCFILMTELVGPKYRVLVGTIITTMVSIGQASLGFIAWSAPHWRTLIQVLFAPQILFISYLWLISESIRWLISKGRYKEAEEVLKKVAVSNKKKLSEKSLQALQASAAEIKNIERLDEPCLPVLVFRSRVMLRRCCIIPIWWVSFAFVTYGMSVNAINLSGNPYINYAVVSLMGIPGRWMSFLLLDRIGRKPVIIVSFCICSICQFTLAFLPDGMENVSLALYLIGKCFIVAAATASWMYTAELFPTVHRQTLFGFCSMVGRIGNVLAPLTPALAQEVWGPLPSVLFGSLALLSALLVLTTPETLGTRLPETMEDAENIGKKNITP